ncbi:MAG: hypothetical protein K2H90_01990 [Oscillospiraceae bacterium]|nr:hypothetical protein [Oscillospiraceae bacterium]
MAKKDRVNVNWEERIFADEMQKTLSYELEHKSLWLWYVLNSLAMFFSIFIFVCTEDPEWAIPPSIQILLLAQYGIMYFCLSLYNIRAARKGVMNSFSLWQKGGKGLLWFVGFTNVFAPMNFIITYLMGKGYNREQQKAYLPFFTVWFCMSMAYYIISSCCVYKNKKVRDSLAADDENGEE